MILTSAKMFLMFINQNVAFVQFTVLVYIQSGTEDLHGKTLLWTKIPHTVTGIARVAKMLLRGLLF